VGENEAVRVPAQTGDRYNGAVPGGGQRRSDHKSGANEHNREGDSQTAPRQAGTTAGGRRGLKKKITSDDDLEDVDEVGVWWDTR
jgi:hypothetical protein